MKKKLNLLWNLKFNFFSVAERPLTFFAYFLNAKKVGRRRLVIVPATAGGLPLFPHAASAFTPALAPVRSHFACGETGLAGYQPHRDRSLVALLMLRKRHHRRTPQSGPAKTLFIFVCTRSTVLRAFGGVYGQHHHQAVQCVGAVGNVQHVGVRPVQ